MTNPNHLILPSRFGFAETLAVLKQAFAAKQITLFAEILHSKLAAEHGLPLAPASLLIVGHPAKGTPLMQAEGVGVRTKRRRAGAVPPRVAAGGGAWFGCGRNCRCANRCRHGRIDCCRAGECAGLNSAGV